MSETALASQPTRAPDLDWRSRAVCGTTDAELLFVNGAQQRQAALICRNCPVKRECATVALDNKVEYGVWGGLTERQRRSLLRKYPDVKSWGAFLARRHAQRAPAGSG
ncbi:WhiB family transcriptional regulator [Mycobacterium sp. 23]|uniref:WhiB family transcriptional regulator n=1 Tax=Mycobacterium sp. 23 TaxID=3400424 RepID=UPI003AAC7ED6